MMPSKRIRCEREWRLINCLSREERDIWLVLGGGVSTFAEQPSNLIDHTIQWPVRSTSIRFLPNLGFPEFLPGILPPKNHQKEIRRLR